MTRPADGSQFLLNRGLLIMPDEVHDRWYAEQQRLQQYFPQFLLVASDNRVTGAVGWLTTNAGTRYDLHIAAPPSYPYECPSIDPIDWEPESGCPHQYKDGSLCVLKPSQWTSSYTLAFMIAKAAVWLNKYEVWRKEDVWPGNQQDH